MNTFENLYPVVPLGDLYDSPDMAAARVSLV
jgi:hypothetical protein